MALILSTHQVDVCARNKYQQYMKEIVFGRMHLNQLLKFVLASCFQRAFGVIRHLEFTC